MSGLRRIAPFLPALLILTVALVDVPRAQAKDVSFAIEMRSIAFTPDLVRVDPGDVVTIRVFNNDTGVPHTFDLPTLNVHLGTVSAPIQPGENRSVTFTADQTGVFYFHCGIAGHATEAGGGRWTGMAGRLEVGDPSRPADLVPIIVIVIVGLAVGLVAVAYYAVRRKRKPA
ncbi:MAG TPA: cupredoxin domain-containing protein [Thermoplasmata archaeon]|nr:cupredoxin domain-containing protein [Thermoplasmata archaeon]